MLKYILLYFLIFTHAIGLIAQSDNDSIKVNKELHPMDSMSNRHRVHLLINVDNRNSFISSRTAQFFGLRLGLEFNHRNRYGLAFYGLDESGFNREITLAKNTPHERKAFATLQMGYFAFFYERLIYINHHRWLFYYTGTFGLGSSSVKIDDPNAPPDMDRTGSSREGGIALFEPSFHAQYKIFHWLGLSAGLGYRFMLVNNPTIDQNFSAPIYIFKIKIFFGVIMKSIFKKESMNEADEEFDF